MLVPWYEGILDQLWEARCLGVKVKLSDRGWIREIPDKNHQGIYQIIDDLDLMGHTLKRENYISKKRMQERVNLVTKQLLWRHIVSKNMHFQTHIAEGTHRIGERVSCREGSAGGQACLLMPVPPSKTTPQPQHAHFVASEANLGGEIQKGPAGADLNILLHVLILPWKSLPRHTHLIPCINITRVTQGWKHHSCLTTGGWEPHICLSNIWLFSKRSWQPYKSTRGIWQSIQKDYCRIMQGGLGGAGYLITGEGLNC